MAISLNPLLVFISLLVYSTGYAFLRLDIPISPSRPEPKSHMAAGIGTAAGAVSDKIIRLRFSVKSCQSWEESEKNVVPLVDVCCPEPMEVRACDPVAPNNPDPNTTPYVPGLSVAVIGAK